MENEETAPQSAVIPMRAAIYAALAKARGEYPEIHKNRVATVKHEKGQYSYKYADLSDIFNAVDPVLSVYGITVIQYPNGANLETVIAHESGDSITGQWPIKAMKGQDLSNAQSYQAAVQVAKRYALTAILGISTEETVEGDMSRKIAPDAMVNAEFETGDGIRMPKGAKLTKGMDSRAKAQEAARAIEDQFKEARTGAGVSGAWDRNTMFIDLLAARHDDLYQNVLEAFQVRIEALTPQDTPTENEE